MLASYYYKHATIVICNASVVIHDTRVISRYATTRSVSNYDRSVFKVQATDVLSKKLRHFRLYKKPKR